MMMHFKTWGISFGVCLIAAVFIWGVICKDPTTAVCIVTFWLAGFFSGQAFSITRRIHDSSR